MTREKKLLAAFALVVGIPVVIIWVVCWPLIRPWALPAARDGQMIAPHDRALTADEVGAVNTWLLAHRTGWGPSGEIPPHRGDVIVRLTTQNGGVMVLSVWHHTHGSEDVGLQLREGGPYRMNSFSRKTLDPLLPQDARALPLSAQDALMPD